MDAEWTVVSRRTQSAPTGSENGHTLPPILEYQQALRQALIAAIRPAPNNLYVRFDKYFHTAFCRFMFDANARGLLSINFIPTANPIIEEDVLYFLRCYHAEHFLPALVKAADPINLRLDDVKKPRRIIGIYRQELSCITDLVGRNNLPITPVQYARLRELYTGPPGSFHTLAYKILYIYHVLCSSGYDGSIPRGLITDPGTIELFGSPLNTQTSYCSAFDIEREYFGSLGNFFSYSLERGRKYVCNPPFIDTIMTTAVERISAQLTALGPGAGTDVIFICPVWDRLGRAQLGDPKGADDPNLNEEYHCLMAIERSPHLRVKRTLHRRTHRYYQWGSGRMINFSHSYVVLLSTDLNPATDLEAFIDRWRWMS